MDKLDLYFLHPPGVSTLVPSSPAKWVLSVSSSPHGPWLREAAACSVRRPKNQWGSEHPGPRLTRLLLRVHPPAESAAGGVPETPQRSQHAWVPKDARKPQMSGPSETWMCASSCPTPVLTCRGWPARHPRPSPCATPECSLSSVKAAGTPGPAHGHAAPCQTCAPLLPRLEAPRPPPGEA